MKTKKELIDECYDKYFNEIKETHRVIYIDGIKYVPATESYFFSLRSDINEFVFNEMAESDIEDVVLETIAEDYKKMFEKVERLVSKTDGTDFHWEDYRNHLYTFEYGEGVDQYVGVQR